VETCVLGEKTKNEKTKNVKTKNEKVTTSTSPIPPPLLFPLTPPPLLTFWTFLDLFMTIYYLSIDFDHSSSSKLYQKQNDFIQPWVLKCLDMTSEDYWVQAEHWSSTIER
jgi:hypothetical protein